MLGSVQISGEDISDIETNDICNSLRNDSIRLLSLRGCKLHDKNYRKIMESIKENTSLEHLNLNLGMVCSKERTIWLSEGLKGNSKLQTLLYVKINFIRVVVLEIMHEYASYMNAQLLYPNKSSRVQKYLK